MSSKSRKRKMTAAEPPAVPAAVLPVHSTGSSSGSGLTGPAGTGRRLTRGGEPALNAELEQLMATTPVAPPEGWTQRSPPPDELSEPVSWEGWEARRL